MNRDLTSIRLLAIAGLLVLLGLSRCVPVSAYSGVIIYDHGFARQVTYSKDGHFIPINKTSSFTQDDPIVWAYVTMSVYNASLTWNWYDPDGLLYRSQIPPSVQCSVTPCSYVAWLTVANTPAAKKTGLWTLDLLDEGVLLYSDTFSISPVITEEDYWNFNVTESAPPRCHADLTVIIHPENQTWRFYSRYIPGASNVTAFEAASKRALDVTVTKVTTASANRTLVTVDLGGAQSDGYKLVVSFDITRGLQTLNGWGGGSFEFSWEDDVWQRLDPFHPIPETFLITLPEGSTLTDVIGINAMYLNLNKTAGARPSIAFTTMVPSQQRFGWTIIYQDFTWLKANAYRFTYVPPPGPVGFPYAMNRPIPVLPLTLGSVSLWTAVMSVFLLTGSELLSPIYARTGILIDRRRLRIAALFLVAIFVVAAGYQVWIAQSIVPLPAR